MFEDARGRNQAALFEDELTRRGCELWLQRVLAAYGRDDCVDVQVIDDQVALTRRSEEHLYTEFTPPEARYERGARPMLEAIVEERVTAGMTDRQKALALMRRVRDNQDAGLARADLFTGGSEEELVKRGAIMCNEVSRLFVVLCQIAGLPARLHCAHISGHMMTEVFTDGRWGWIDAMKGIAAVTDDDRPASVRELLADPTLFERQPRSVWDDCRSPRQGVFGGDPRADREVAFMLARNRDCYFNPREAVALGNYFVADHGRYDYPWRIGPAEPERLAAAVRAEMLNRKAAGWPDYYFNPLLFDERLSPR